MRIEQALYTSAETARASGYHLVAWTDGVSIEDRRELSQRGPSHDSLLEEHGRSVNFHALPSGAYCVSSTQAEGAEFSHRRGPRITTRCLVILPEDFLAFANSPFRLLKAVDSLAVVDESQIVDGRLPTIDAPVGPISDGFLLMGLLHTPGERALLSLLNSALMFPTLGVAAGAYRNRLTAGLLSCLPIGCRTEFSFSTGLKYSPQRPFRLICLSDSAAESRRLERRYGFEVWSANDSVPGDLPEHPWIEVVRRVIHEQALEVFCDRLTDFPANLGTTELPLLSERILQEWSHFGLDGGVQNSRRQMPAADLDPASAN